MKKKYVYIVKKFERYEYKIWIDYWLGVYILWFQISLNNRRVENALAPWLDLEFRWKIKC